MVAINLVAVESLKDIRMPALLMQFPVAVVVEKLATIPAHDIYFGL
jgi:hypothetical protein